MYTNRKVDIAWYKTFHHHDSMNCRRWANVLKLTTQEVILTE